MHMYLLIAVVPKTPEPAIALLSKTQKTVSIVQTLKNTLISFNCKKTKRNQKKIYAAYLTTILSGLISGP
jgi:hypothetical protein